MVDWIWRLSNIPFESSVLENWRPAVLCHCAKVKERGQNAAIIEVFAC